VSSDGPKESRAEGHCHGNQFWDAICNNWLCVNDRLWRRFEWSADKIVDNLQLRDVAWQLFFWLSLGYNFGCMIASNTLFNSRVGFRGQAI